MICPFKRKNTLRGGVGRGGEGICGWKGKGRLSKGYERIEAQKYLRRKVPLSTLMGGREFGGIERRIDVVGREAPHEWEGGGWRK